MPSRPYGFQRSASRWAFQASASLGATLIAALIVQALPRAVPEIPRLSPELTSGGKFAARIASARAYDGLDTMPLPRLDPAVGDQPPIVPAAFLTISSSDPAGLGAAPRQPTSDGLVIRERTKTARVARGSSRAEARRTRGPTDAPVELHDTTAPAVATVEPSEDGLLRQVVTRTSQVLSGTSATTRDAWTATASVGSSLVSRLIP